MRILRAAIFLLLTSVTAHAQYSAAPMPGFFWNPGEPGKGWAFDVQDNLIFVAHYSYQPTGGSTAPATFYTTLGTWNGITRSFTGDLLEFQGGSCLTCGPSPPTSRNLGPVTFQFANRDQGTLTFQGRVTPIQRFAYNYPLRADAILRGAWHTTTGAMGIYFGDFLRIVGPCTIPSCAGIPNAFLGYRVDGGVARVLVGGTTTSTSNEILIILDTSPSFYDDYRISTSLNLFVGSVRTYLKTSTPPPGAGLPAFGSRLFGGPNEANIVFGPPIISNSNTQAALSPAAQDARAAERAEVTVVLGHVDQSKLHTAVAGKAPATADDQELRSKLVRVMDELTGNKR